MIQEHHKLNTWLGQVLPKPIENIVPLAGDCSLRRYYRILTADQSYILMEAPIDDSQKQFLKIARKLESQNLKVPHIFAYDEKQELMLLSDLGDTLYLDALEEATVDILYQQAIDALLKLQMYPIHENDDLPVMDTPLLWHQAELFIEWYLKQHLKYQLDASTTKKLHATFEWLISEIEKQPKVLVHMDYHSKNLMVLNGEDPGILDFQDAKIGPITYDLSSLLKDAYIKWPHQKRQEWIKIFQEGAIKKCLLIEHDILNFQHWFELTGIQRHLKNLGIFARLCYREKRPIYLQYLPLLLEYIDEVCEQYSELKWLGTLLKSIPSQ